MRHDVALILGQFWSKLPICLKWRFYFGKLTGITFAYLPLEEIIREKAA